MLNRNFNSVMTMNDLSIRQRMTELADAHYLIADKSDFEFICEWMDAEPQVRRERVMAESYAAAMYGTTER